MFRSLKQGMNEISKNPRLKKYFIYDKIQKIWETQIDSCIQENTKIINLNNDVITIRTSTPAWKTELAFQKSLLLTIINKNLKLRQKIKDIKFI